MKNRITEEEIEAKKTAAGGWTKKDLEAWGVPWPPPKGWKRQLIENGAPYDPKWNTQ